MSDEEYRKILSKKLNYYLNKNQKTQKEVADFLNISTTTFNNWCMGISLPRMGKIQMLADYFGIEKSDLLEEKNETSINYLDIETLKQLNRTNIDKVNVYSRNLLNIQNMEDNSFDVIAAHERTDTNVTNEMIEHDNDIMDDDNF